MSIHTENINIAELGARFGFDAGYVRVVDAKTGETIRVHEFSNRGSEANKDLVESVFFNPWDFDRGYSKETSIPRG